MFVLLGWLTESVSAGLRGHFYLVKLKTIWIIDGENDTSVARGNERLTPSSLLSLLWLTESANKDDTWQLTRPIMGGDMHTYTEEGRKKENKRGSMRVKKYKWRAIVIRAPSLRLAKELGVLSETEWFSIQQPILESQQMTLNVEKDDGGKE